MLPIEYEKMQAFERWYWWYQARRRDLIETVRRLGLPCSPRVLDVGCGSGLNLVELTRTLNGQGFGIDASANASQWWRDDEGMHRCLASANDLPYADATFDLVVSADVIGCDGVDAERSILEMARLVRPGGYVVLFAPAFQWLRSRHDAAVHSVRRFTRSMLRGIVETAGLNIVRASYRFFVFFPIIAMVRLATKPFAIANSKLARSDLSPLPSWMNRTLLRVAMWELTYLGGQDLPLGSSVLIVARKGGRGHD